MDIRVKTSSNRIAGIFLAIVVIILASASITYYQKSKKASETIKDLSGNIYALKSKVQQSKVRINDSTRVNVARVRQLALEAGDWKKLYKDEVSSIKNLKSRLSDIENVATTATVSSDTVLVPVIRNIKQEQVLDYRSKWIDIQALIDTTGRTATLQYEKRDSLVLVHLVERKSILWGLIRFGRKSESYEAFSLDPKTKIESLSIKKIIK